MYNIKPGLIRRGVVFERFSNLSGMGGLVKKMPFVALWDV